MNNVIHLKQGASKIHMERNMTNLPSKSVTCSHCQQATGGKETKHVTILVSWCVWLERPFASRFAELQVFTNHKNMIILMRDSQANEKQSMLKGNHHLCIIQPDNTVSPGDFRSIFELWDTRSETCPDSIAAKNCFCGSGFTCSCPHVAQISEKMEPKTKST